MFLKWNKHRISNVVIMGTEITKGSDKILISLTHSGDRDKEDEYPGLITMRRGDRHNELFTHHFLAYGLTDEEVYNDAERLAIEALETEIQMYNNAINLIMEVKNSVENGKRC
jgi:hypothetical protein